MERNFCILERNSPMKTDHIENELRTDSREYADSIHRTPLNVTEILKFY